MPQWSICVLCFQPRGLNKRVSVLCPRVSSTVADQSVTPAKEEPKHEAAHLAAADAPAVDNAEVGAGNVLHVPLGFFSSWCRVTVAASRCAFCEDAESVMVYHMHVWCFN